MTKTKMSSQAFEKAQSQFREGVYHGLIHGCKDTDNKSIHYKEGYEYGIYLYRILEETWRAMKF